MVGTEDGPASSTNFNALYYMSQPQGARQAESGQGGTAYQSGADPTAVRAKTS